MKVRDAKLLLHRILNTNCVINVVDTQKIRICIKCGGKYEKRHSGVVTLMISNALSSEIATHREAGTDITRATLRPFIHQRSATTATSPSSGRVG